MATCAQALVSDVNALVAYWAMNEGTGDYAYDSSNYGNTGLLVADAVHGDNSDPLPGSTAPDWITGHDGTGSALQFCSGADNYNSVWVAKSDSLKDLYGYWSFSMWIREDNKDLGPSGGGYDRVISCPNYEIELGSSSWNYDYLWPYGGHDDFQTDIGQNYTALGGNFGEWYHMALTYDGNDLKKYLNGTLVDSKNIPGKGIYNIWDDSGWTDAALKLGCQTWPNKDWLEGALDDVAIYAGECLEEWQVQGLADGTYDPLTVIMPEPMTMVLGLGGLLIRKRR
jgi:hypothetical protein